MKVLDIKILKTFSIKESKNFDMKVFVKFREGIWPWRKTTEHTVCRYNPIMPLSKLRWRGPSAGDSFYYDNGSMMSAARAELLHTTLRDIEKCQNDFLTKKKLTAEISMLNSEEVEND